MANILFLILLFIIAMLALVLAIGLVCMAGVGSWVTFHFLLGKY